MRSVIFPLIAVLLAVQAITAQDSPSPDQASRGMSLAREGRYAEAEQELRQAVRAAPAVAQYRAQLGSVLGLRGKWKEKLESFQKAVDLSPQNLDFRRETAAVQWQMGLMLAAEKNLDLVLAKQPSDPGAILLLGLVKEKIGDYTLLRLSRHRRHSRGPPAHRKSWPNLVPGFSGASAEGSRPLPVRR